MEFREADQVKQCRIRDCGFTDHHYFPIDRESLPKTGCHFHWQEACHWQEVQEGEYFARFIFFQPLLIFFIYRACATTRALVLVSRPLRQLLKVAMLTRSAHSLAMCQSVAVSSRQWSSPIK